MKELEEYEYLWTTGKEEYVLVRGSEGYAIVEKKNKMMLLIEDDNIYDMVVDQMLQQGNKIIDFISEI